ncbi:MAG: S8 family serine peptidase [Bacteroidales bacterium]
MRTIFKSVAIIIAVCISVMASSQILTDNQVRSEYPQIRKIERGIRPPIDLQAVPETAFEPGRILVKFSEHIGDQLKETQINSDAEGYVKLSNEALDNLNRQFGVSRCKSLLHDYYTTRSIQQEYKTRHNAMGLQRWYELTLPPGTSVKEAVQAYSLLPEVEIAEPVYLIEPVQPVKVDRIKGAGKGGGKSWIPDDELYGYQWSLNNTGLNIPSQPGTPGADIKAEAAWNVIKGNPDVIVAVIDQGIQFDHPDLAGNMWPGIGPDGTQTVIGDHGTHVAGTIAAVSNNALGVAGIAGGDGTAGSGVKLMSIARWNNLQNMNALTMNIYAADNGAAITQNSWGYSTPDVYNQADLDGIDYFNAYGGGSVMNGGISIFSAGNNNANENHYPAYYSGAVSVASTTNTDEKSDFSNYGLWIDLAAPGSTILSTGMYSDYYLASGTSMACPHVSGVAALVLSYAPGSMTNQELWDLLKTTTDNIDALNPDYAGLLGTGRLNAWKAIETTGSLLWNISGFEANAISGSEIELLWQTGSNNYPVLIAWSSDDNFGVPADGITYTSGETLPGGGTVIYSGAGQTSLDHTGLNFLTDYYYRAWSYDGSIYSYHRAAMATTLCPDAYPIPFSEDFNNVVNYLPCWTNAGSTPWKIGTFAEGLTGTTGYYAWVKIIGNVAANAYMISPHFDFSNVTNVQIGFKHRYNHSGSSAAISYSLNGGNTWTVINTWTSNIGTVTFSQTIAALAGQPSVLFRWSLDFPGGGPTSKSRSWSVDDVTITGTAAGNIYTITATAGTGGTINPSGTVNVTEGNDQAFSIAAGQGYEILDLLVDNVSLGALSSYTFYNVTESHTIHAEFLELPLVWFTISASAGEGGSIDPAGDIEVVQGGSQSFTITADAGMMIADVLVNGISAGAVPVYTFNNVQSNQSILATFTEKPDDPCKVTLLPYSQDFNIAPAIPECWNTVVNQGTVPWEVGTFTGGLSGTTGNYAYFYFKGNKLQEADLISPAFDFSNYTNVNLSFKHNYIQATSTAILLYSTDGGNTWTTIQNWTANTGNPATFSQTIAALAGVPDVKFCWRLSFAGGGSINSVRSWSVDDIVVSGTLSDGKAAEVLSTGQNTGEMMKMSCFPNPVSGVLNILLNREVDHGLLIVSEMHGREVKRLDVNNMESGQPLQINTELWPSGLYVVRLVTQNGMATQIISCK